MRSTRLVPLLTLMTMGSLTAALALPNRAEACGGTFCDTGPNAMPVDQTGENIMFVIDGAYVEAHIQIQYDPNTVKYTRGGPDDTFSPEFANFVNLGFNITLPARF